MDIVKMNHQKYYFHRVRSSLLEISITDGKISKPEFFLSRKVLTFAGLEGGHNHRKQKTTWRAYIYSMASGGHGTVVNAPLKQPYVPATPCSTRMRKPHSPALSTASFLLPFLAFISFHWRYALAFSSSIFLILSQELGKEGRRGRWFLWEMVGIVRYSRNGGKRVAACDSCVDPPLKTSLPLSNPSSTVLPKSQYVLPQWDAWASFATQIWDWPPIPKGKGWIKRLVMMSFLSYFSSFLFNSIFLSPPCNILAGRKKCVILSAWEGKTPTEKLICRDFLRKIKQMRVVIADGGKVW